MSEKRPKHGNYEAKVHSWAVEEGMYLPTSSRIAAKIPAGNYDILTRRGGTFGGGITPILSIRTTELETLVTPESGPHKALMDDISKFWTLTDKYEKNGFIHRRGYLVHGPPGTGKTSIINLVASWFTGKCDGLVLFNHGELISDGAMLQYIRQLEPERPIIHIIEEVEMYGQGPGLATFIDAAPSGYVMIATTNYPERLDPKLVKRPRRFDRHLYIGPPDDETRTLYLRTKFPALKNNEVENFSKLTEGLNFSAISDVAISNICYEEDINHAVKVIKELLSSELSSGNYTVGFSLGDASESKFKHEPGLIPDDDDEDDSFR